MCRQTTSTSKITQSSFTKFYYLFFYYLNSLRVNNKVKLKSHKFNFKQKMTLNYLMCI